MLVYKLIKFDEKQFFSLVKNQKYKEKGLNLVGKLELFPKNMGRKWSYAC